MKVLDRIVLKICDLVATGTIERLEPQIIDAIFSNGIDDRLPIRHKGGGARNARIGIEQLHRRVWSCIERNECNL